MEVLEVLNRKNLMSVEALLGDDFIDKLEDAIDEVGSDADPDDVLAQIVPMIAKPSDFYFAIGYLEDMELRACVVIAKQPWDKEQVWDDRNWATYLDMDKFGLVEECECIYDFTEAEKKVKEQLINAGFIEKQEIID